MTIPSVATLAPDAVVELRQVWRSFPTDPVVHALRGVDLTVNRGEYLSVVGPSGSGKSTLLNILGCLDRPTQGHYYLDGFDTGSLRDGERAGLRASRIGFVFQSFHLLAHRTALENVMLAELYRNDQRDRKGRRTRAEEVLGRVGLAQRRDFLPTKLSGGERQRVAIARALLSRPSLLLCDEPTGNLDSGNTASILALFDELQAEGLTIVIITHEHEVSGRAQRVVHMNDGVLLELARSADRPQVRP